MNYKAELANYLNVKETNSLFEFEFEFEFELILFIIHINILNRIV